MTITPAVSGVSPTAAGIAAGRPAGGIESTIGGTFEAALEGVSSALAEADLMSQQVATGQLSDLSQLTAAAAKAELAVDLTVAFRDRAIDSFQQIMNMQI